MSCNMTEKRVHYWGRESINRKNRNSSTLLYLSFFLCVIPCWVKIHYWKVATLRYYVSNDSKHYLSRKNRHELKHFNIPVTIWRLSLAIPIWNKNCPANARRVAVCPGFYLINFAIVGHRWFQMFQMPDANLLPLFTVHQFRKLLVKYVKKQFKTVGYSSSPAYGLHLTKVI